jgi:hypothetical protein
MTIEITEFRCPTCGHILGEEEHRHALSKYDKDIQAIREEERVNYQRENQQLQIENQQLREDIENRVSLKFQSQKGDIENRIRLEEQEKRQLAVHEALNLRDNEWRQEKEQFQQLIRDLQKDNGTLKNRLESIPPERRGTAGEKILTKDLHEAFPQDNLEEKRVGEEMPDIIQTIVT